MRIISILTSNITNIVLFGSVFLMVGCFESKNSSNNLQPNQSNLFETGEGLDVSPTTHSPHTTIDNDSEAPEELDNESDEDTTETVDEEVLEAPSEELDDSSPTTSLQTTSEETTEQTTVYTSIETEEDSIETAQPTDTTEITEATDEEIQDTEEEEEVSQQAEETETAEEDSEETESPQENNAPDSSPTEAETATPTDHQESHVSSVLLPNPLTLPEDLEYELMLLDGDVNSYVEEFESIYKHVEPAQYISYKPQLDTLLAKSWTLLGQIELARLKLYQDMSTSKSAKTYFAKIEELSRKIKRLEPIYRYMAILYFNSIENTDQKRSRTEAYLAEIKQSIDNLDSEIRESLALNKEIVDSNYIAIEAIANSAERSRTWSKKSKEAALQRHYNMMYFYQQLVYTRLLVVDLGDEVKIGKYLLRAYEKRPITVRGLRKRIKDVSRNLTLNNFDSEEMIELSTPLIKKQAEDHGFNQEYARPKEFAFKNNWVDSIVKNLSQNIKESTQPIANVAPVDFNLFCPGLVQSKTSARIEFWTQMTSKMVELESYFKSGVTNEEDIDNGEGSNVISRGLLQISYDSAKLYGCSKAKKASDMHKDEVNFHCYGKIVSNRWGKPRHSIIRFLTYKIKRDENNDIEFDTNYKQRPNVTTDWYGMSSYWAVFRTDKVLRIQQHLQNTKECHRYTRKAQFL